MADPLEALRAPHEPVAPDPRFAARLRERLQRALALPEGVTVSDVLRRAAADVAHEAATLTRRPLPPATAALTPYLAVAGAPAALDWYEAALGARRRGEPLVMPDGTVGHAELEVAGARLMLSEQHPEIGVVAPTPGGGSSVTLHLEVDDVDLALDRAVATGAELERPAADHPYGRNAVFRDPFGHRWMLSGPVPSRRRHGDIGYASLWVDDARRVGALLAEVLGWSYAEGAPGEAVQVTGQRLHHGVANHAGAPTLLLCFAVADLDDALRAVAVAGGTAGDVRPASQGRTVLCADDQGAPFALYQPASGVASEAGGPAVGPGDLAYVTMEVPHSSAARAFYGTVLGWRFRPGRVDDGWQIEGVDPPVGLRGGAASAVTVPVYAVADLDGALERLRAGGGQGTDPEAQPYGRIAECSDGHGLRFGLLEVAAGAG